MKYLLDTHVFLWSLLASKKLSLKVKNILLDPEMTKYVSTITFWEISLKFSLGKITLKGVGPEKLPEAAEKAGFDILLLKADTASSFYKLPKIKNKDPFDRMLAWQTISEDCILLTPDRDFANYKIHSLKTVW